MRRLSISLVVCASFLLAAISVRAVPTINVGNINLKANTAGQTVQFFVTGGDAVQGLDFRAQVADGGPVLGGTTLGPRITNVDIITGTPFATNNTGVSANPGGNFTQFSDYRTTTASGTVPAVGLLATVTFDTTGFTTVNQQFPLLLTGTKGGNTDFTVIAASITNGTITIVAVPEPSTLLGLGALVGGSLLRRRKRIAA